ncbi:MAG: rRNA maturation RNase YbeY [Candidatus Omnitrophota bacterium]|nr:rRNA maturation RNase YbeY [Candidatus Omnitrophota bacterium]
MRPAYSIEILNLNRAFRINEKFLKKIVLEILAYIKKTGSVEIEIVFLDDRAIRVFNKKYKGRNASTDVLSFKLGVAEFGRRPSASLGTSPEIVEGRRFLGEILISSETAFANSKVFGTEFYEELVLYVIHGILHLFGYDDKSAKDKIKMSKEEEKLLGFLCKRQKLSEVLTPR